MNARTRPATLAEAAAIEVAAARAAGVYSPDWTAETVKQRKCCATQRYLSLIADGDVSLIDAAKALGNRKPATLIYYQGLEARGLVARSIRDGRSWISITPAGTAWLAEHGGEA